MFDLQRDPMELVNVYNDAGYSEARVKLTDEYHRLRTKFDAPDYETVK